MEIYLELGEVSSDYIVTGYFLRLCLALEKKFRDKKFSAIQEWQQIEHLCAIALEHENCFFMFENSWLKTKIVLKDLDYFLGGKRSKDELRDDVKRDRQITIRRNVLPGQFYHRSYWECSSDKLLDRARKALTEKLQEQREQRENRRPTDDRDAARGRLQELRVVDPMEVVEGEVLGKGNEGYVCKVVWGNYSYAMKLFEAGNLAFVNEHNVAKLRSLAHAHIVQAFGRSSPDNDERPFLLMELLDGTLTRFIYEVSLSKRLLRLLIGMVRTQSTRLRPFSRADKLDVLLQIASAMRTLHANNVVHGDLKLDNILLSDFQVTRNARHFLAKVADFGSARIVDSKAPFKLYAGGTREYAAPELLKRWIERKWAFCESLTKVDVYSFGVVGYEILTGYRAFNGSLAPSKMKSVVNRDMKLTDCPEWRNIRDGRYLLDFEYFSDVIPLVESCLEMYPEERPEFPEICFKLRIAKLCLQDKEKLVANCRKLLAALIVALVVFLYCPLWVATTALTCLIGMSSCSYFWSMLPVPTSGSISESDSQTEVIGSIRD